MTIVPNDPQESIQMEGKEAILEDLKKKKNSFHPDKNGGNFKSSADREEYYRLMELIS